MKSLWNDLEAKEFNSDLDLRVYTSRLLGQNSSLVLHGGGNTSVKTTVKNLFNEDEEIIYVKGSGWDLATIQREGFAPVKMDTLLKMADLKILSDKDMVKYQRAAMLDPNAPTPSVEAILHAIIPFKFVDHTHANTVVTISNTPNGEEKLREIYGERVLIIPYVMPGFDLAKLVYEATKDINWKELEGIILLNHGVFTFANDAKTSYENMINLITESEKYLLKNGAMVCGDDIEAELSFFGSIGVFFSSFFSKAGKCFLSGSNKNETIEINLLELAKIRKEVSLEKKHSVVVKMNNSEKALHYSNMPNIDTIATQGPLTPDHVIRTKRVPLIIGSDIKQALHDFIKDYNEYFEDNKKDGLVCLNHAPNWAIVKGYGTLSFGKNMKEAIIIDDIVDNTMTAVLKGEALGGYKALTPKEIFDVEYWELEQAKLKKGSSALEFEGKVVLVCDALNSTQKACIKFLAQKGATIAAIDNSAKVEELYNSATQLGLQCNLSNQDEIKTSIDEVVRNFGGIDIVISDIGVDVSNGTDKHNGHNWQKDLDINVTKHQNLIKVILPYLKEGINPNIVIIASKNFISVGQEHVIYNTVENDQIQLSNKTTQEMNRYGIRVNTIYPRNIYNAAHIDETILQERADECGLSIEEYLADDELKKELESHDSAILICNVASSVFNHTTGAQLKVDSSIVK